MHHRVVPLIALVALLGGAAVGCGIDEGVVAREAAEAGEGAATSTTTAAGREDPEPTEEPEPVPFTVDAVPDGYELVVEGPGEDEPIEGEPRPVTVLAPDGEPEGEGVVFVEPAPEDARDDFVAATDDEPWARLVEDGVQVWGLDATDDDLQAVAEAAEPPTADGEAPTVPEPPAGLEVVGSLALDGVVAVAAGVGREGGPVTGPASAWSATWHCAEGCDGWLVAMGLPAGSLDPAAVVAESRTPRRALDEPRDSVVVDEIGPVEDVTWRGVVVDTADPATGEIVRRTLAVETDRGVILLVARGQDLLGADELVEVAESVALG